MKKVRNIWPKPYFLEVDLCSRSWPVSYVSIIEVLLQSHSPEPYISTRPRSPSRPSHPHLVSVQITHVPSWPRVPTRPCDPNYPNVITTQTTHVSPRSTLLQHRRGRDHLWSVRVDPQYHRDRTLRVLTLEIRWDRSPRVQPFLTFPGTTVSDVVRRR